MPLTLHRLLVGLALLPLLLAGCAWQPEAVEYSGGIPVVHADTATASGRAAKIAAEQVGTPYRYGGASPQGFDCSGLVYYSYQRAGSRVPRTSISQYSAAKSISLADARPGDLLFFASGKSVDHVALYIGNNAFVHAPSSGKNVTVNKMSDAWYRDHFVGAGRLD